MEGLLSEESVSRLLCIECAVGVNDYHQSPAAVYNSATSLPQYYADSRWSVIRPPLSSHAAGIIALFTKLHFNGLSTLATIVAVVAERQCGQAITLRSA